MEKPRIMVAALNWGLGHATRCIPIIRELEKHNFEPILASDGQALSLLEKEFPYLTSVLLPPYGIEYPKKGVNFKWKLMMESPKIMRAIKAEKKMTKSLVNKYDLQGIISDNRLGVRSKKLKKNVFITNQLNVLSGNTSFLSSYIHQNYIRKFEECWIPDLETSKNLSGKLGHLNPKPGNIKYIGILSRLEKKEVPNIYDYIIILSGPEPQRSILESILIKELKDTSLKILFIRGVISEESFTINNPNINVKNYLFGKALEEAINCSKYVVSRSGYTTLMDLAKLEKKAFFIPTPGQWEQQYLAERMQELELAPYCQQEDFNILKLEEIEKYGGLRDFGDYTLFGNLFAFFQSE